MFQRGMCDLCVCMTHVWFLCLPCAFLGFVCMFVWHMYLCVHVFNCVVCMSSVCVWLVYMFCVVCGV